MTPSPLLFDGTPSVIALDNRGLPVRDIAYHRHPDTPDIKHQRLTRHRYAPQGFLMSSTDPRLHDVGLFNFIYLRHLNGGLLYTQGADNGTTLNLSDTAGRPLVTVSNLCTDIGGTQDNSQSVTRTWQYEGHTLPGRPLSLTEQVSGEAACITERFVHGSNSQAQKGLNLAGRRVSHYDTAGLVQTDKMALTGIALSLTRRLLKETGEAQIPPNWKGQASCNWNDLLAAEGERHTTLTTADACAAVLATTDAKGNVQRVAYDVAGLLAGSWLTMKDGTEQVIVKALAYSAAGQKRREEHGNGVVSAYSHEPYKQRLSEIRTERPKGHVLGAKMLQDLRYAYDPVGNVLKVSDNAGQTRFWRNQKVQPQNSYRYDSLYQLVSATGREMANAGQQGCTLPPATIPPSPDDSAYTGYLRTYTYDIAGNLTRIRHDPATGSGYTTKITTSNRSNRAVLSTLADKAADVDALFRTGGQQTQLQPGQSLTWTPRNELLKVTPVVRAGGADDSEHYRYDSNSQRILKVSVQKTNSNLQIDRTLYLSGLELKFHASGDTQMQSLQVITIGEAGRSQVRVLHWEIGKPTDIGNDQIRYSYDNLTGSSGLELDGSGNLISREEYYPYGGTSVLTTRSQTEAKYKTLRYSGKERDATGLYYYGYRYCQPWVGRWLSADPAGTADGLNLFRMLRNNPCSGMDRDGRIWEWPEEAHIETLAEKLRDIDRNVVLAILELDQETNPDPRDLAAYIISGINNDFGPAKDAMTYVKSVEPPAPPPPAEIAATTSVPVPSNTQQSWTSSLDIDPAMQIRMNWIKGNAQVRQSGNFISTKIEGDLFQSDYFPRAWIVYAIFKDPRHKHYFASDVAKLQYDAVSEREKFDRNPNIIIHDTVINQETLKVMNEAAQSGTPLRQPFLWNTPNGKSARRLMDVFNLEARKVTRAGDSFIIHVKPKPSKLWRPWQS